jgi:hypothetical protein
MNTEPARWIGYVTTAAGAIIGLAIAFGANITDDERNAIIATIVATGPIILFIVEFTRSKVTPTEKAQDLINIAAASPPGAPVPKV